MTIVDTLRMTDKDLQRVLSLLPPGMEASDRSTLTARGGMVNLPRMVARLQCREGGGWITHLIKPREIHPHGVRFYFGQFIHQQVRCSLLLRDRHGQPVQLAAVVTSCRHLNGRVHEVTARFDRPIAREDYQYPDGTPVA